MKNTYAKSRSNTQFSLLMVALILAVMIPGKGYAKTKNGFYVAVGVANTTIGGSFDGNTYLRDSQSVDVCPSLGSGMGPKIAIGYKVDPGMYELGYQKSDHSGKWQGMPFDAEFSSFNFDVKCFVYKKVNRIRPLIDLGVGITSLTVKEGSTDGYQLVDVKYSGIDYRIGGGVEIHLIENATIDILGIYRYGEVSSSNGITSAQISDTQSIENSGFSTSVELKYVF